jgi:hypothetical protein
MGREDKGKKLTLKHGRGKVHELDCRWVNGPRMDPEWVRNAYHVVPASEVRGRPHCSSC